MIKVQINPKTVSTMFRLRSQAEHAKELHDTYVRGLLHGAGHDVDDLSKVTFNAEEQTLQIADD